MKVWKSLAVALALATTGAKAQPEARFDWFEYRGSDPVDAVRTPGPGDYRNPILQGFYPDPSVTRVGDDFYLVTSTFSYFPGIPVFRSRDLVNWTQIGNAIDRPDQLDFKQLGLSRGVFAPTITHKDGVFYVLNTCVDCGGNYVLTASDPKGPWSDPVFQPQVGGIDPSLFFDDDGRAWMLNNEEPVGGSTYDGHRAIWIQEFDTKTLQTFGPRTMIVNGGIDISQKPIWIEGPHIFRKDGWYYLSAAEGGTAEAHSQVILRSKNVTGPYVPGPNNPILTQRDLPRDRAHPITSAGHAQLVTTPAGDWWATFLAVRPYEGDFYNTGRETFLMPVTWEGGWPRITRPGETIPYAAPRPKLAAQPAPAVPTSGPFTLRDEFDGEALPPYWMMMRNPRERWYALEGGALVLTGRAAGLGDNANPSFLARRQQHLRASAETVVRFTPSADGDSAGLVALQSDEYFYYLALRYWQGKYHLTVQHRAGANEPVKETWTVGRDPLAIKAGDPVHLRVTADGDRLAFAYAIPSGDAPLAWRDAGAFDGKNLSTKVAGGFVGAVFGVHAQAGK